MCPPFKITPPSLACFVKILELPLAYADLFENVYLLLRMTVKQNMSQIGHYLIKL